MKKFLLVLPALAVISVSAFAEPSMPAGLSSLITERDALKAELAKIKGEVTKCEKQKKGGIAMTVIGATGTVATGIAAGVQGKQLSDKKKELRELEAEKSKLSQ